MDKTTREILVNKLGTLQVANAELAAENMLLSKKCQEQSERILEMEKKVEQPSLPIGNLPANPYDQPEANGAAH